MPDACFVGSESQRMAWGERSRWAWLMLLPLAGVSRAQLADLRVTSSAFPASGLAAGQEVVVTTTVFNDGPDAAQNVSIFWSAPVYQPFVLEDPDPVTPGCGYEPLDIDPPRFNFSFSFPVLAAGAQRTCVARMRVRIVPADYQLLVGADVQSGQTPDPRKDNNEVLYHLLFAKPSPMTIPTTTGWGLLVMVAGALSLAFIHRSGGRHGSATLSDAFRRLFKPRVGR